MTATKNLETLDQARATVCQIAEVAFATHQITELGPNEWRCGREKSGYYCFRIIVRPGTVLFWGDIGEAIFYGGDAGDTLDWLRRATSGEHHDYLISKLRTKHRKTLYPGDARDYLQERLREARGKRAAALSELIDALEDDLDPPDEHTWPTLVYDATGDAELCSVGLGHSGDVLWIVEALRWFVVRLDVPAPAGGTGEGG